MSTLLNRFAVPVVLSLLSMVVGCAESGKGPKSAADAKGSGHAEVGKPAPDLSIQTLNGKGKIDLESAKGKVLVVDFWATWCGPCKESFPKLEEMGKRLGDKVEIVGISVDDEKKGVLDFAKANGATFAIGWDEGHSIAERWKVGTMPTTFVVDLSGKVRHIHDGYHPGETDTMAKEITALYEEGPGDTKVAEKKSDDGDKKDAKEEKKEDRKEATKEDEKKEEKKSEAVASNDEPAADPPKKKGGKKGGRAGGKTGPQKKHAKKK